MSLFTFQSPSAETYTGDSGSDLFVASNAFLNAGDRAFGNGGVDDFQYYADVTLTPTGAAAVDVFGNVNTSRTFSAFTLNSVETFTTINDSGSTLIFDMSSSSGITDLVTSNSTFATVYDQVTNLANVRSVNQTLAAGSNMAVGFQAALLAGANDSVNLVLDNTNAQTIRIGTSSGTIGQPANTGVETIHLTGLGGNSVLNTLDVASLTSLIIDDVAGSAFNITITNALAASVATVTNNSDGGATISAAAAGQAVTFTGVGGADNFTGGAFNDTFNLGDGNNTAVTGGGANSVTTGAGTDLVLAQGTTDTVNTGAGNDTIADTTTTRLVLNAGAGSDSYIGIGGNFNASTGVGNDSLNMGGDFDVLFVDAGTTDAMYAQATNVEGLAIYTAGVTTIGATAQASGINSIYLGSGSAGNDVVNAGAFTTGLTVTSASSDSAASLNTVAGRAARFGTFPGGGGDDTVTTGTAVDYYLFRGDGALTDADVLRAGTATNAGGAVLGDTLVLEGNTTLAGGGSFAEFEFVALESAVGSAYRDQSVVVGNTYNLTLTDANAPSAGVASLYINGSNLQAASAGVNTMESANIDASAVTLYSMDITTGAGDDFIQLGALGSRVLTQGGDDIVIDGATGADDIIDTGLGNDAVFLTDGNNTVFDEGGNNQVALGTGNDSVFLGGGNDLISVGANLTAADVLVDGGGYDAIYLTQAGFTDAQMGGVNTGGFEGFEVLFVDGGNTYTLGANASRAGFRTIVSGGSSDTINLNNANFNKGMQVDLSAGGNDVVNLGSPTAIAPGTAFDFITPTQGFSWPPAGAVVVDRTANANLVVAGIGVQTVNGGTGSDVVRVDGTEFTGADFFAGAAGYDAIQLDNTAAGVTAVVNLTNVTNVELVQTLASGDLGAGVDTNVNNVTFTNGAVGTLTNIRVDNSALNDAADTTNVTLDVSLTDADYAFLIDGAQAGTTNLVKNNVGINNNINFQGGAGVDTISINGGDLGSTTIFNGNGGIDRIIQTGGIISDDSYSSVDNVEVLTATVGNLNATLGAQAAGSGINTVIGTSGNDLLVLDAAFTSALAIQLNGGNDNINGQNAAGTLTFSETLANITAADTVRGGANGADVFNVDATAGGAQAGNFTNVSGVETYNVRAAAGSTLDLTLGADPVAGGSQTFNITQSGAGAAVITTTIHGSTENANTTVNALGGNDAITLGGGNDVVNGGAGNDSIYGNGGNDTLNGGTGADQLTGGNGTDTLSGGDGIDWLRGQAGNDQLFGDAGNDIIYGGAGGDTIIGGAGADEYLYSTASTSDSPFATRDTVTVGTGDTFSFSNGLVATPVTFVGSQANFADSQSAITAGGGIEAVFQADSNVLWVDINDDGALNNNDLQINILFADGLSTMTNAMFVNTTTVGAFDAAFTPAV